MSYLAYLDSAELDRISTAPAELDLVVLRLTVLVPLAYHHSALPDGSYELELTPVDATGQKYLPGTTVRFRV
jgi:hypothetical protein